MHPPESPLDLWTSFASAVHDAMAALAPAVLGSAVGQAWKTGLSWKQRIIQWLTGILVSYYVTAGVSEYFGLGPFVAQAIGFTLAMIAFELTPRIIDGCTAAAARIPDYLASFVERWTR